MMGASGRAELFIPMDHLNLPPVFAWFSVGQSLVVFRTIDRILRFLITPLESIIFLDKRQ